MEIKVAIAAVVIAAGSLFFAGWQTRISRTAEELTLEREVVTRIDELLFKIADDPPSRRRVWGEGVNEDLRPEVASQALANMLAVALVAVRRLPGFKKNKKAWCSYTKYMLERSPGLRNEILNHPDWWPDVTPVARAVANRVEIQEGVCIQKKTSSRHRQ
jgi:hypothetical protein